MRLQSWELACDSSQSRSLTRPTRTMRMSSIDQGDFTSKMCWSTPVYLQFSTKVITEHHDHRGPEVPMVGMPIRTSVDINLQRGPTEPLWRNAACPELNLTVDLSDEVLDWRPLRVHPR